MRHPQTLLFPDVATPQTLIVETLMPYGVVAKAIFVKANGLPAYNLAMGLTSPVIGLGDAAPLNGVDSSLRP